MAVHLLRPDANAHILCLVGAPMSGAFEIADALGHRYEPLDLAGGSDFGAIRWVSSRPMVSMQLAHGASTVVVVPGVPTVEVELRLLNLVARTCGLPLSVLELAADDLDLVDRAYERRRCPNCGQSRVGGQVRHDTSDMGCAVCRDCSSAWPIKELSAFLGDLNLYRQRLTGLRTEAANLDVPWICIRSLADPRACSTAVRDAIEHLAAPIITRGSMPTASPYRSSTAGPSPAAIGRGPARRNCGPSGQRPALNPMRGSR